MNVETIKRSAAGRWSEVIGDLAPHLRDMIERGRRHGPCQLCGGKDRARCHDDFVETGGIICNRCDGAADGFGVLMWANDWNFSEALEAVTSYLGLKNGVVSELHQRIPPSQPKKDWKKKHREVMAIWEAAIPNHSLLNKYLECRGLSSDQPDTLRLHPSLEYWYEGKSYGKFPCMVSPITRDSSLVGIHRTFLDLDTPSKATVPKPKLSKKCVDSMTGSCIRLFKFDQEKPLVLCEGIETALAVHQMTCYPVWACVSSTMMGKVVLPNNIKSVIIAADKDKSGAGEKAADKLAQRLIDEGRKAKISLPPLEIPNGEKSVDWLDFLNSQEEEDV